MLLPYGSKHNRWIIAKVGGAKAASLMPYGARRHGALAAKVGTGKASVEPMCTTRERRVIRLRSRD